MLSINLCKYASRVFEGSDRVAVFSASVKGSSRLVLFPQVATTAVSQRHSGRAAGLSSMFSLSWRIMETLLATQRFRLNKASPSFVRC
eukprot:4484195-Amphidinium_carterae.1